MKWRRRHQNPGRQLFFRAVPNQPDIEADVPVRYMLLEYATANMHWRVGTTLWYWDETTGDMEIAVSYEVYPSNSRLCNGTLWYLKVES
jgi:hypothetical protein